MCETYNEKQNQYNHIIIETFKSEHLFDDELSEHINKDNETIINECLIETNIEENVKLKCELMIDNINTSEQNLSENNQTYEENVVNTAENINQNFEYISKDYQINKIDLIVNNNKQKLMKVKKKTIIRSHKRKSKVRHKKIQTNTEKDVKSKTDNNSNNNLIDLPNVISIPRLIQPEKTNELFECDNCLQLIRIEDRDSHDCESHHMSSNDAIDIEICYICELEFNSKTQLIAHNKKFHSKSPFNCAKLTNGKVCGKIYSRYWTLNAHNKKVHCNNETVFGSIKAKQKCSKSPIIRNNKCGKLFTCLDCGKHFELINALNSHRDDAHLKHKYVCDWNDCQYSTSRKSRLVEHKNYHLNIKSFHCDWPGCDYQSLTRSSLFFHSEVHGDRKFRCPYCHLTFKRKWHLKEHIECAHIHQKTFECSPCKKKYGTKQRLLKHTRDAHTEKRFQCDKCSHKEHSKAHLERHHRRVHLREKTFICNVKACDAKYFAKHELLFHQSMAHSDERKFVCDWPECGSSYKLKKHLSSHVKRHTGDIKPRKRKQD